MTGTLTSNLIDEFLFRSPRDEAVARDWMQTRDFIRTEVNTDLNVHRTTGGRSYNPVPLRPGAVPPTIQSEIKAKATEAAKEARLTARGQKRPGPKIVPAKRQAPYI